MTRVDPEGEPIAMPGTREHVGYLIQYTGRDELVHWKPAKRVVFVQDGANADECFKVGNTVRGHAMFLEQRAIGRGLCGRSPKRCQYAFG